MKVHREKDGTLVVALERGEPLRERIEALAAKEGIAAARVHGIGAVEGAELGCYVLSERKYLRRTFPGILELVSLEGNLALKDGKPFLHAHATLAGEDFAAFGGHLFDARVGVLVEIFVLPLATPLPRVMCDEVGLAAWEPGGGAT